MRCTKQIQQTQSNSILLHVSEQLECWVQNLMKDMD